MHAGLRVFGVGLSLVSVFAVFVTAMSIAVTATIMGIANDYFAGHPRMRMAVVLIDARLVESIAPTLPGTIRPESKPSCAK